ncbi:MULTISPECIES: cell wall metabolism sensor histidine kinase WalK [unclassified Streptomyces]|uniref:sensor histidine kinase n=2 Tax=unclassified Streptomyces TaxID=2593676 RepID=UPI0001C1B62B|nr:integral membrane sensor signal transduction histidine kinase [Streptomyces sp. SirexAA-E]MYR65888.1 HAMP domain-containing protein [Streptomyces sp. SID4939]MYS04408.1 HAMP domain-containing protein [Streptomyces sp. SID4940]MYT63651.1 HAMP domain-containing protein [Streptomyces sp. SID8357]MYT85901.1 HAMP domain-containing protein [Streptomyces sp. SID8360]MYW38548.1 HAMP domain-containing protein [Streptomyces sp. SID1]PZX41618.1 signal transduction histidine kinase [Streptomyces sp. D
MTRWPKSSRRAEAWQGRHSTIRMRIALVYGGVFLVLGTALLATVNLASRAGTDSQARAIATSAAVAQPGFAVNGPLHHRGRLGPPTVYDVTDDVSDAASRELLYWSVAALLVMTGCAVAVGWWTAGRVLRPVHAMTAKARKLSEHTLHERIAAGGPDDELKELGETLDALLARLEKAFDSQRRFIANASHELRTPLATQRAAIQIGLDDPSPEDLVRTRQTLLDNNRRSERLIEGLLVLARSERGLAHGEREDVDLAQVVAEEAARPGSAAGRAGAVPGPEIAVLVEPCVVRGNRQLLAQLVANLLSNAVRYNVPGGTVDVSLSAGAELVVRNTGPQVADGDIAGFFQPFRRGEGRDRMGQGSGLGLSIVRSIAVAHGGTATARPGPGGGLAVTVRLPAGRQSSARSPRAAVQAGSPASTSR